MLSAYIPKPLIPRLPSYRLLRPKVHSNMRKVRRFNHLRMRKLSSWPLLSSHDLYSVIVNGSVSGVSRPDLNVQMPGYVSSLSAYARKRVISKTCLYNFDPLKPHFYMVKLWLYRGIHFLFSN